MQIEFQHTVIQLLSLSKENRTTLEENYSDWYEATQTSLKIYLNTDAEVQSWDALSYYIYLKVNLLLIIINNHFWNT